jgi:hypothetical protein
MTTEIETKTLISFHGDPAIKEKYLERARAHREMDDFIKGTYGHASRSKKSAGWKGCAVGCLAHSNDNQHEALSKQIGIPVWMAYLIDGIFEGLPEEQAKEFPVRFIEALPVGVDLEPVKHHFLYWLLADPEYGVIRFCMEEQEVKAAVEQVANLHKQALTTDPPTPAAWDAARAAAWAAAWAAARAAAWAAARDAAWAAARDAAWDAQANKLIELLGK